MLVDGLHDAGPKIQPVIQAIFANDEAKKVSEPQTKSARNHLETLFHLGRNLGDFPGRDSQTDAEPLHSVFGNQFIRLVCGR